MPLIQVPKNARPRQIEFDDSVERSKPGALYFTPGSTKTITKGELEFMKKHHKEFVKILIVLPFDETKGRLAKKKAKVAPAPKRPKDKMSKAKARAEKLLKGAKEPPRIPGASTPVPAQPAPLPKGNKNKK